MAFSPLARAVAAQTNYDSGDPTAEEQYILEVVNRARMNPAGEGARLHININEGLTKGTSAVVRPPLAMNKTLLTVARAHSDDMFNRNYFAHTTPEGQDPFDRMDAAGYNGAAEGENIALSSQSGNVAPLGRTLEDNLMVDAGIAGRGHRVNLLDIRGPGLPPLYREIGVGLTSGMAGQSAKTLLTQDFGDNNAGPFVLGVVYNDANHNGFYDVGEGLSGVTVTPNAGSFSAVTGTAGGFAFPVSGSGMLTVTASGGGLGAPMQSVISVSGQNVKIDFTSDGPITYTPAVEVVAALKGQVPGQASGTTFAALGAAEAGPFAGTYLVGKVKTPAIFSQGGVLRVKVGDEAPGLTNSKILKLGAPGGDVVRATLQINTAAGVTAKDNEVLIGGLTSGTLTVVARKGQAVTVPGGLTGVTIKTILNFDGAGPDYFFLALLQGSGVTPKNDSALCVAPGDGSVRVVMREQQSFGGTPRFVSVIGSLVALPGTLGEGRWRATAQAFGVRVTFLDKGQQYFTVPATATSSADWISWNATNDPFQGGLIKTLGFPGFGATGVSGVVTLKSGTSKILPTEDTLVIRSDSGGTTVLATEGDPAPDAAGVDIPGATFKAFGNPVCGAAGSTALTATLAGVKGNTGIWYAADGVHLRQLARAGEPAPGGGKWTKFTQLALSDEAGGTPYFTGTLAVDKTLGISAGNNSGLWAIDAKGKLVCLLKTGVGIDTDGSGTPRTLTSFTTLTPGADSLGSAHGYDAAGTIAVRATFQDKTVAVMRLAVP